ncbi:hypothetical protein NFI96_022393 [Prochilodus magdalenae]|nr:hypothetical protein NFI96_022393 [Prochilodus magdalenae]
MSTKACQQIKSTLRRLKRVENTQKSLFFHLLQKIKVGDLIEIFRGPYQHWAIYVGDGYVIHLAPPSEVACAGASSVMSVLHDVACVKKQKLSVVVGDDDYRVNNLLDEKYEPQDIDLIVKEAHRLIGRVMPYNIVSYNCEHFVTELRYGKPTSRQVRRAAYIGAIGAVCSVFGVLAAAAVLLSDSGKEKKNKY